MQRSETKWCGHDDDDGVDNNIIKPTHNCTITVFRVIHRSEK